MFKPGPGTKKQKLELLLGEILENTDCDVAIPSDKAERELRTYASEEPITLQEHNPLLWWKGRATCLQVLR